MSDVGQANERLAEAIGLAATGVARQTDLDGMVRAILDGTIQGVGASQAFVCTAHDEAHELRFAGGRSVPPELASQLARISLADEVPVARAAASRVVQVGDDYVAWPLVSSNRLVGVLGVVFDPPRGPDSLEWAIAQACSYLFAAGLDRVLGAHEGLERELRESLAIAQRAARLGSWDWDVSTGETHWSDETFRIFGLDRSSFLPTFEAFLSAVHEEDRERVRAAVERALQRTARYEIDHRIVLPDGTERIVREEADVVPEGVAPPRRLTGTVRDVTEVRRIDARLARLAAIVSSSVDAIIGQTTEGVVTDWNPGAERLYGYSAREMIGTSIAAIAPEEQDDTLDLLARVARGEAVDAWETRRVRKDGKVIDVSLTMAPVLGPTGGVTLVSSVERDITGRKQTADDLRAAEERLRLTIDEAPIGLSLVGLDGRFLRVNRALCEMLGYKPEELLNVSAREITHPEDRSADIELTERLLSGQLLRFELPKRYLRKDGSVVDVVLYRALMRDARGRPLHFIAQILDVSERRRYEEERERLLAALESERTWLRTVIERSPVATLLFRPGEEKPTLTNHRAEELLYENRTGSLADRLRRPDGSLLTLDDLPSTRALRGEIVQREELMLVDGRTVSLLVSAAPIHADGIVGAVVVAEDVSVLKELQRMRDEWVSIIAHDLRQPVAAISTYAAMLARRPNLDERARAGAQHMLSSVRRLDRMIGDLLDVSRLETNRLELELQPTDLVRLTRDILERLGSQLGSRPVRVETRGSVPLAKTDPVRFEQALGNLLSNAVKYGDPGTEIVVSLERAGDEVEIAVINRGPGIPARDQASVFHRFSRTPGAKGGKVAGLGLGLYITRGLVEANGGRIWVESTPNDRTAFRFTLPIATGAEVRREGARDSIH